MIELIANSWNIGEKSIEKSYALKIYDELGNTVLYLSEGKETATKKSADVLIYGEDLHILMDVSY